ncbi:1-acyl-sn-glycerol-3-phosphate acyltransferase alpha [Dissostichus eleginoides]|uniref:1-acyl-sn-glycerol-3-phosphate acyltransferase alpha n=1 Tax=Dissostichus eleginoides TaxID=100907 RepID=A0AAD9FGZ1_DISEL|nr:1-acyl-sn-glycerol-3-phosphate acyltransferase alpha [Dissostichus eleginoides]
MQCYCGVKDNTSVWFCPCSPPFHFVNGGYLWVKSCNHILPQQPEMTTSGHSEASEMMTQRDKASLTVSPARLVPIGNSRADHSGNERGGGGSIPGDRSSKGSWERVVGEVWETVNPHHDLLP